MNASLLPSGKSQGGTSKGKEGLGKKKKDVSDGFLHVQGINQR